MGSQSEVYALEGSNADLADTVGEAQAGERLGEAQDGEQRARRGVAVGHLRLRLLLPHLRIHRRHILCTRTLLSAHSSAQALHRRLPCSLRCPLQALDSHS